MPDKSLNLHPHFLHNSISSDTTLAPQWLVWEKLKIKMSNQNLNCSAGGAEQELSVETSQKNYVRVWRFLQRELNVAKVIYVPKKEGTLYTPLKAETKS